MYKGGELCLQVTTIFSSGHVTSSELFTWDPVLSCCSQRIKKDNEMFTHDANT